MAIRIIESYGRHRRYRSSHDSSLEGGGFELPVPRAMQARLEAKIAGFGCMFAVDYLRLPSVAIS